MCCCWCVVEDAARLLLRGQQNRHTSSTNMNRESSRSHSVFTCVVESKAVDEAGLATMLSARVNLVDLAGQTFCTADFFAALIQWLSDVSSVAQSCLIHSIRTLRLSLADSAGMFEEHLYLYVSVCGERQGH